MTLLFRKLGALLVGIGGSISLSLMHRFPIPWVFFLIFGLLILLIIGMSFLLGRRSHEVLDNLPLSLTTALACVGLFTLMDWRLWRFLLIILIGVLLSLLFGWEVYRETHESAQKPFRRMKMMLWVFNGYALITTMFAFTLFFPRIPFWVLLLVAAVVVSFISSQIWRMYYAISWQRLLPWVLLVSMLMIECMWAVHLLPFGYLVSGFLATWMWYLVQLFIRFHFGPQGVIWEKQWRFLLANAVCFVAVLYLAQWV